MSKPKFDSCSEEGFAGYEHHDEIGGNRQDFPVFPRRKRAHVVTNLTCMVDHLPLTRFLIVCIKSSKISLERCLGVNARQPDNHVRAQTTPIAFDGLLLNKINVLRHSCHFEHVSQLILAPAAARL